MVPTGTHEPVKSKTSKTTQNSDASKGAKSGSAKTTAEKKTVHYTCPMDDTSSEESVGGKVGKCW